MSYMEPEYPEMDIKKKEENKYGTWPLIIFIGVIITAMILLKLFLG